MAVRLTNQIERLSYTRKDVQLIDEEVDRFITNFIPTIRDTGTANTGRLFLRLLEALVDKLNYSIDQRFRQSVIRTVKELQAAIDITELVRFTRQGTVSATVDLTLTTLGGAPAPGGGIPVAQYQQFTTETSPVKTFLALNATSIPEGATSGTVEAVQGVRVVAQTILASAAGVPNEEVVMPVAKTPVEFIEIEVDGVPFSRPTESVTGLTINDFRDSIPTDRHFIVKEDEDNFSTIIFGDGEYGVALTSGQVVTATYIQSLGEDGNSAPGTITKIQGSLSQSVAATNEERATGGSDGDIVEDIVRNAPRQQTSFFMGSNEDTMEALAETLVSGVFRALADEGVGPVVNLYIMPTGGGVASSTILAAVEDLFNGSREIHGATVNALALQSAHILISMRVILQSSNVNKSVARKTIFESISDFNLDGSVNEDGALYFRNLTIGRGFAQSDVAGILENLEDGTLVDFVDFLTFTRYPTPVASNPSAPEFSGEIVPLSPASYDSWSLQAVSTTEFRLFKNTILDSEGTIGVTHTSDDGSIRFTLGSTTDTFTPGDTWTFKTSAFVNNMRLDPFEFMELFRDSDLSIQIFYPEEFTIGES